MVRDVVIDSNGDWDIQNIEVDVNEAEVLAVLVEVAEGLLKSFRLLHVDAGRCRQEVAVSENALLGLHCIDAAIPEECEAVFRRLNVR